MSERKVLNQYIPVDYDPTLVPKGLYKRPHQYKTRVMLPFNVQCASCNHFMYRGRKFNAKKETSDKKYLGIAIFRFYLRCENCANEITFLTDPQNFNYTLENGAVRMFEYALEKEQALRKIREDRERDEKGDIMKMLENRTAESLRERQLVEALDELEDLRKQQELVNVLEAIDQKKLESEKVLLAKQKLEEDEDEAEIARLFGANSEERQALLQNEIKTNDDDDMDVNEDELEEFESEDEDFMMFGYVDESTKSTIQSIKNNNLNVDMEPKNKKAKTESVSIVEKPVEKPVPSFFFPGLVAKKLPASGSGAPGTETLPKKAVVTNFLAGYSSDSESDDAA